MGGITTHDPHLDPGQGHRRLHEPEVREAEEDPLTGIAGDERAVRLVVEIGPARRGHQVPLRRARRIHREGPVRWIGLVGVPGDRSIGQERVRVDAAVEHREVRPVVGPFRQLDVGVRPVGVTPHLAAEHRELPVEARGAVSVVVGVLPARVEGRVAVLGRPHEDEAGHPHVHVLRVLHVAVEHVGAGVV